MYRAYLFTILTNNDRSLTKACSLILKSVESEPLDAHEKKNNYQQCFLACLSKEYDLEVIWILYILLETQTLSTGNSLIDKIVASSNELAQIMLLRKGILSDSQKHILSENARSWILIYELYTEGILSEENLIRKLNLSKKSYYVQKNENKSCAFLLLILAFLSIKRRTCCVLCGTSFSYLNLLTHDFQPHSSNIPPDHHSKSNPHSSEGRCK